MQRITIEVEQDSDLQLLLRLAKRIGLRVIAPMPEEISLQARERHLEVIERGGDNSIEDPVAWQREQREQREDRALPR